MLSTEAIGALAGGAFGAYEGDLQNDPLSGLMSAAVGAGVGTFMKFSIPDLKKLSTISGNVVVDQKRIDRLSASQMDEKGLLTSKRFKGSIKKLRATEDKLKFGEERSIDRIEASQTTFHSLAEKDMAIEKVKRLYEKRRAAFEGQLSGIHETLAAFNIHVNNDLESITNALDKVSDPIHMKRINSVLEGSKTYAPSKIGDEYQLQTRTQVFKGADKEKNLYNYLVKNMGHSTPELKQLAKEKAALIAHRSGDSVINMSDHNISFTDIAGNKNVTMPLSAYTKDGVRYHNAGNGSMYAVSGYNPYGRQFVSGQNVNIDGTMRPLTAQDMMISHDPEMMLKHLKDDQPLSQVTDRMKSLMGYDANDSDVKAFHVNGEFNPNQNFRSRSALIEAGHTLDTDLNNQFKGDKVFARLGTSSSGDGGKSELNVMFSKLAEGLDDANHLFDGVSGNNTTAYTTQRIDTLGDKNGIRGSTSVSNRDYLRVGNNADNSLMEDIKTTMGASGERQFSNGQVFKKLDIYDPKAYNDIMTKMLGADVALGDGSGVFNLQSANKFAVTRGVKEKITTNDKGGLIVSNPHLQSWLEDNAYNNGGKPMIVKGGDILGYDAAGNAVKVHEMYSEATISGFAKDKKGNMIINMEGTFNPHDERIAKLFSQASKSNLYGIHGRNFGLMSYIGEGLNTKAIGYDGNVMTFHGHPEVAAAIAKLNNGNPNIAPKQLVGLLGDQSGSEILKAMGQHTSAFDLILDSANTGSKELRSAVAGTLGGKLDPNSLGEIFSKNEMSTLNRVLGSMQGDGGRNASGLVLGALADSAGNKGSQDVMAKIHASTFTPIRRLIAELKGGRDPASIARHVVSMQDVFDNLNAITNGGALSGIDLKGMKRMKVGSAAYIKKLESIDNQLQTTFRNAFNNKANLSAIDRDLFLRTRSQFGMTVNPKDILRGDLLTIGSVNTGQSVLGIGNRARMSWNARYNLQLTGFTDKELSMFGKADQSALLELRSTIAESKRSGSAVTKSIASRESTFREIMTLNPEERSAALEARMGIKVNSPYITHNLHNPSKELQSLNFARVSTNRSGYYSDGQRRLQKELDGIKGEIFALDVSAHYEQNSVKKASKVKALKELMTSYGLKSRSMYAGDNNLLKAATSLYSDHSMITLARTVGGQADAYTAKAGGVTESMFLSMSGAEERARRLGIKDSDLIVQHLRNDKGDIIFDHLREVGYKGKDGKFIPLSGLVTREPAQGALSSQFTKFMVDTTINSKGTESHLFIPESNKVYKHFMFGDFDQDTLQELYGKFSTHQQYADLMEKHNAIRGYAAEMLQGGDNSLIESMKVKGKSKEYKTFDDFIAQNQGNLAKAEKDFNAYKVAEGLQGRARKLLAAPATSLAMSFGQSLHAEYANDARTLTRGRFVTHQLVENLLKSAHLSTDDFARNSENAIELMTNARAEFVKGKMTEGTYAGELNKHLNQFLNIDKITDAGKKAEIEGIRDNIVTAEINQARNVNNKKVLPIDLSRDRNSAKFIPTLESISQGGLLDVEQDAFHKNYAKSGKQLYNALSDGIVNTFKDNKNLLLGGAVALGAVSMISRQQPSFRQSPMQHSSGMLQAQGNSSNGGQYNAPLGQPTSSQKTGYITPKTHTNSKHVRIQGDFIDKGANEFTQLSDEFDNISSIQHSQAVAHSMSNAIFGNGIRTARVQNN